MHSLRILLAVLAFSVLSQTASAEKRVALVIGNSAYQNVPRLTNPANDAAAIGEMFRAARFDVVETRRDLGIVDMRRLIRNFTDKSRDADIAVIYYAGHGIEVDGINYLIPTDAVLERDRDAFDEAIQLDRALQAIEPAKTLRLVILDACRDNPFQKTMKRAVASRTLERGLATVEPTKPNTLIAFAAKGGSTADDGSGLNSPFTTALLQHLATPGFELRKAFGLVRDNVMKATNNKQEPFVYGSLGGTDVSLVPAPTPQAIPAGPAVNSQAEIRRDYELAERIGTLEVWDTFLQQYPTGLYADFAKAQVRKLQAEGARLNDAAKTREAEAEKARLGIESARAVAEKARQAEEAKAELAARARAAIDKAAAEKLAKESADAEARAAEAARKAAEKEQAEKTRMAALEQKKAVQAEAAKVLSAKDATPPLESGSKTNDGKPAVLAALPATPPPVTTTPQQLSRSLQAELRRVGCQSDEAGDDWNDAARRSLTLFNKKAGSKLDVKLASLDALDAVRSKTARVCPLTCDHGFRANGEQCTRITCKAGFEVGDDNTCERIEVKKSTKPVAKLREPTDGAAAAVHKPEPPASAGGKDMGSLYAQCRTQAIAQDKTNRYAGNDFRKLDACARNGGRL